MQDFKAPSYLTLSLLLNVLLVLVVLWFFSHWGAIQASTLRQMAAPRTHFLSEDVLKPSSPPWYQVDPSDLMSYLVGRHQETLSNLEDAIRKNETESLLQELWKPLVKRQPVFLCIAISTAPENFQRRIALRSTWLRWLNPSRHAYRFFTDDLLSIINENYTLYRMITAEQAEFRDMIFLPSTGLGRRSFGQRGMSALSYIPKRFQADYVLRVDDDGFLCLPQLLAELESGQRPKERFVWGKYWRRRGSVLHPWKSKQRMDDNMMVMSGDVVEWIVAGFDRNILAFEPDLTLSVNFAYWSHFLNLTIFDDRGRIDSQQNYLTEYMHRPYEDRFKRFYPQFCRNFLYAHRVRDPLVFEKVFVGAVRLRWPYGRIPPLIRPQMAEYAFDTWRFSRRFANCSCRSLVLH